MYHTSTTTYLKTAVIVAVPLSSAKTNKSRKTVAPQTAAKNPLQQFLTAKNTDVTSIENKTPPMGEAKQQA